MTCISHQEDILLAGHLERIAFWIKTDYNYRQLPAIYGSLSAKYRHLYGFHYKGQGCQLFKMIVSARPISTGTLASPRCFDLGGRTQVRQTHLPPSSDFSSDFVHFILKMLKNDNVNFFRKNKKRDFWADVPPEFWTGGMHPPSSLTATSKSSGECL